MQKLNNTPYDGEIAMTGNPDVSVSLGSMGIDLRELRHKQKQDRKQLKELSSKICELEDKVNQINQLLSWIAPISEESVKRWAKKSKRKKKSKFGAFIMKALPTLSLLIGAFFNRFAPDTRVLTAREQRRYLTDGR